MIHFSVNDNSDLKKPSKPKIKKPKQPLKADIATRIRVTEREFSKIPQKEPFIIKKLMNEIIPKSLQKDNLMANAAFS